MKFLGPAALTLVISAIPATTLESSSIFNFQSIMTEDTEDGLTEIADPTRMGWRRRRMALIVALMGLGTFVAPLIETDSEILGRMRWSPFAIILAAHDGRLPIHQADPHYAVSLGFDMFLGIGAVYLLLTLIAALTAILPSPRFVGSAAAVGLAWVFSDARHGYYDLRNVIYGAPGAFTHKIHAGSYSLILCGVLGLLCLIAATKQLD